MPIVLAGTLVSILEKILAQKTDCESPSSLVIEAAQGNTGRVREMLLKHPDKVICGLL